MLNEVPKPGNPMVVGSPAVVTYSNLPVAWYSPILILGREVVLAFKDDVRWGSPPSSIDSLDNRSPLTIAWLYCLRARTPI